MKDESTLSIDNDWQKVCQLSKEQKYCVTLCSISQCVIGLHRISYPAPAEIWPHFYIRPRLDMAAGYEAGFDHIVIRLPHCQIARVHFFYEYGSLHLSRSSWLC